MSTAVITPGGDQPGVQIQKHVSHGADVIHIEEGEYVVSTPIFLHADHLHLIGHNARLVWDKFTAHPLFFDLCGRLTVQGLTVDWRRPKWRSYSKLFLQEVPQSMATSLGWNGPLNVQKVEMNLLNNTFIDTANGQKSAADRDNWITVWKNDFDTHNLLMRGNRIDLNDTELTGGNFGYQSVEIDGNICRGDSTTGGFISMLSRYDGTSPRPMQDIRLTNNIVLNQRSSNFITFGYDATAPNNNPADSIRIEGNIAVWNDSPNEFIRLANLKMDSFKGTAVIRNNHIVATGVNPNVSIKPRDIVASNRKAVGGRLFWSPSAVRYPVTRTWPDVRQDIKETEFAAVIRI